MSTRTRCISAPHIQAFQTRILTPYCPPELHLPSGDLGDPKHEDEANGMN